MAKRKTFSQRTKKYQRKHLFRLKCLIKKDGVGFYTPHVLISNSESTPEYPGALWLDLDFIDNKNRPWSVTIDTLVYREFDAVDNEVWKMLDGEKNAFAKSKGMDEPPSMFNFDNKYSPFAQTDEYTQFIKDFMSEVHGVSDTTYANFHKSLCEKKHREFFHSKQVTYGKPVHEQWYFDAITLTVNERCLTKEIVAEIVAKIKQDPEAFIASQEEKTILFRDIAGMPDTFGGFNFNMANAIRSDA